MSLLIFLSGHIATVMRTVHTRAVEVISLKFISSCPTSACIASKKIIYFLSISSQKGGRKTSIINLESCNQILEETSRIRDPVQFTNLKGKWPVIESNVYKNILVKHNFSL